MGEIVNTRTGEVVSIEPRTAKADELDRFAVTIRDWIPDMGEEQLDDLEATLVATAKRLRILGRKAAQAEASRALTLERLGQVLGPAKIGRPETSHNHDDKTSHNHDVLALSGQQRNRRSSARLFAEFSDFVHQEIQDGLTKDPPRVSPSKLIKLCQRRRSLRDIPMPDRRYSILLADPPWRYDGTEAATRQIENQYGTLSLEKIKALGEKIPAADDAVLFFWVTSPKLADGLAVVKDWGFEYRTCMIWVKDRIGMGYYARQQHELLFIATRGNLGVPKPEHRPSSVFHGDRAEHSAKPDVMYELIESMYAEYERSDDVSDFCELFARTKRPGWNTWGLDTAL